MEVKQQRNEEEWSQIVVFHGLLLPEDQREDFEEFCKTQLGAEMKYLDEYTTLPGEGGEGGRTDVMVRIKQDAIPSYAVARFQHGDMTGRWWEDVVDNNKAIIPKETLKQYPKTW